ncbi:peroxidase, putative; 81098-80059 [Arabidopsis thaliana]|uniref:peroxidase n=1 Tax=Arabidopsis thaliana TaxID=3702 RepID=V9H0C8_ARATH|nr:probable peroxidase, 81098-80059 [imported] - Arabidopsis thaliana [Arabidopsis thaliana]AAG51904.1 peroxidase, putative; 81098-80059 [Arabidopsis thaliana]
MRAITASFFIFCFLVPSVFGKLRRGFYDSSCPLAESTVSRVVAKHHSLNQTVTAALLRMQFHDCFVNGCDASLLIDSTPERPSEKSAEANVSVRGFEIIDEVKKELEIVCPKTVSCADIVTLATKDSIALAGKGLNVTNMVALIGGGHSVGVAHCSLFQDRLKDPKMDSKLKAKLQNTCRGPNDPSVVLDQMTPLEVDNQIYKQIKSQRGILRIDQNLGLDDSTSRIVSNFALNETLFGERFAEAMQIMGEIKVLTGNSGEIRTNCIVVSH